MKKSKLLMALVALIQIGSTNGGSFEDQFHERMLEVGWKQSLMELERYTSNEQRYILERALLSFGPDPIPREPERQANFKKAQSILLSAPGHAKYYQDKIDKMRAELLAHWQKPPEERLRIEEESQNYPSEAEYLSDIAISINTLRFMPSAETVSVLGYFLNDPVGRDGMSILGRSLHRGDSGPHLSNAELATDVIRDLGIEQPPFRDNKSVITPAEIDAWKDWWNEVKSGKRTYRFIGSSVEYGPDGPATKEVVQHVERDRKRDEEREAGHRKSPIAPEAAPTAAVATKPFSIAGILAACALIGAAVWYFLGGRKVA